MGTTYSTLTQVVNNLVGGYQDASWVDLGTGTSFDVKNVCQQYDVDYTKLTVDDFVAVSSNTLSATVEWATLDKSYDISTGVLTFRMMGDYYSSYQHHYYYSNVHAYLLLAKKAGKQVYDLGTAKSFNVKSILEAQGVTKPDSFYQGLTANDFLLQGTPSLRSGSWYGTGSHDGSMSITKSYNSSTFVLTMQTNLHVANSGSNTGGSDYYTGSVNAYLVA